MEHILLDVFFFDTECKTTVASGENMAWFLLLGTLAIYLLPLPPPPHHVTELNMARVLML